MMRSLKIFPECYADTLLTETLFPDLKLFVSHKEGSDTARDMEQFPGELIIGIVDKDKEMPTYFQGFQVMEESTDAHLRWWKHSDREHHIVILEPAIERWLYHAASKVNPQDFDLPETLADRPILKQFKKKHSRRLSEEFRVFVDAVCKQDTEPILTIRRWMQTILQSS